MAHAGTYIAYYTGDVPTINVDLFSGNVFQVAEQKTSKLMGIFDRESLVGGQDKFIPILSELSGTTLTDSSPFTSNPPYVETGGDNAEYEPDKRYRHTAWRYPVWKRRLLIPQEWRWAVPIERNDPIRVNVDINSEYVKKASASLARRIDAIATTALNASVTEYQKSTSSDGLNPGDTSSSKTLAAHSDSEGNSSVISDGGTGLTVEKLRAASLRFDQREVPEEGRYFYSAPKGKDDLLATTEVTSIDYNTVRALASGQVNSFMGFTFIWSNRLSATAGVRSNFAFHRDGLKLGIEETMFARQDELPDWNYIKQTYMALNVGALRMDEDFVIQVDCVEAS